MALFCSRTLQCGLRKTKTSLYDAKESGMRLLERALSPGGNAVVAYPWKELCFTRHIHATAVACRTQAGKYRTTPYKTKPLTYEMANYPATIGRLKSWNTWNTGNLHLVNSRYQMSQMNVWDAFIRRFVNGTWHGLFVSEIIIKRRYNAIYIAGIVQQSIPARKMYFLIGYTEEFLSYFLKCPVKMELQSVFSKKDVIYKYI